MEEDIPDKLVEELSVDVPCLGIPIESIGDPFPVVGTPWIFPLVDDEGGTSSPVALKQARAVMLSLVPRACL